MKKQYEAMFLVSPAAGDGDKALEPVKRVLDRAGAEVLVCKKWDERKLAYEVGRQKRGVYVLAYFRCEGGKIADLERDVQLSDTLLRVLVLQGDDLTPEQINKPTPAETGHSPQADLPIAMPDRDFRDRGPRDYGRRDREPAGAPHGDVEIPDALGDGPTGR